MTTAKEDLKLKADKRGFTSDAEEFAALEQIKQAEQELRELMQYYGRAGSMGGLCKVSSRGS
jgi:hypothetical protein